MNTTAFSDDGNNAIPAPKSKLTQVRRASLRQEVVDQLRSAIIRGELKAGTRVTELGLAKELGVSQPTIREALIELGYQGFFERRGPRETVVTVLSAKDIQDIYAVRIRLETLAVELVSAQEFPDVTRCQAAYERMVLGARLEDRLAVHEADLDFHRSLWEASGNRTLQEILVQLVPRLFGFFLIQRAAPTREHLMAVAEEHGELVQAIRAGRSKAAVELMEVSMQQARSEDSELAAS